MKELLVPCGNMTNLIAAIHSGADAVYLGGKRFGARAFAGNFSDEEMVSAIKLCHLYDVKIYVTVNTLCFESEFEEVTAYLTFLHKSGVDAVIVQDLGLIKWIHEVLPNLEIHASTQVHTTNTNTIKLLEKLGVKRVVVARELSLDEINKLDTSLEIEAFIHGALCISYSGECLFSSILMNRSGNRGECAQICRLPFELYRDNTKVNTDGSYLLSTKELNTSSYFKDILDSKVVSLKIEGRMKSAEYVSCVTRLYRDLIDKYNANKPLEVNKELLTDLTVIFNREYTKGFINTATNKELMNIKTSNHLGVSLGSVTKCTNKYIYIKLDKPLYQGDGIRFNSINEGMICNFIYDLKENLINHGDTGDTILVDNRFNLNTTTSVNKTLDIKVLEKYQKYDEKKLPIDIELVAKINEPLILTLKRNDEEVTVSGAMVSKAINAPLTKERIKEQISKLGDTSFKDGIISINMDEDIFIPIKTLNELRREATTLLKEKLENRKKEVIINEYTFNNNISYDDKVNISVLVRNKEQLELCLKHNIDRIIVADIPLYLEYKYLDNVYYRTSRIGESTIVPNMVACELGSVYNKARVADYYLNIANHGTIDVLKDYVDYYTLSVELSNEEIANIMSFYNNKLNAEVIVYSNVELMITKYCPLNLLVNKDINCKVCSDKASYYLSDRNNEKYRILQDKQNHLTHIMHHKPIVRLNHINTYLEMGIKNFRVEFLEESINRAEDILNELERAINDEEDSNK